jgi:hypothetical protein
MRPLRSRTSGSLDEARCVVTAFGRFSAASTNSDGGSLTVQTDAPPAASTRRTRFPSAMATGAGLDGMAQAKRAGGQRPRWTLAARYDNLAITYRATVVLSGCITWTRI